jgi:hypothetical protein
MPKANKEKRDPVAEYVTKLQGLNPEDRGDFLKLMEEDRLNLMTDTRKKLSKEFGLTERQFNQIFEQVEYKVKTTIGDLTMSARHSLRRATRPAAHR